MAHGASEAPSSACAVASAQLRLAAMAVQRGNGTRAATSGRRPAPAVSKSTETLAPSVTSMHVTSSAGTASVFTPQRLTRAYHGQTAETDYVSVRSIHCTLFLVVCVGYTVGFIATWTDNRVCR